MKRCYVVRHVLEQYNLPFLCLQNDGINVIQHKRNGCVVDFVERLLAHTVVKTTIFNFVTVKCQFLTPQFIIEKIEAVCEFS